MNRIVFFLVLSFSIFGFAKAKEWRDPVTKMDFVWVPGGTFHMGCHAKAGKCGKDEKPVRTVRLDGFWIGKKEVSKAQWRRIMGKNQFQYEHKNEPVHRVSWNTVQQFIRRLNGKSSNKFSLPSEAQWEYACRAGGKSVEYGTGNGLLTRDNANAGQYDNQETRLVGKFKANGLGLHDMSGNVSEWVQDKKTSYRNVGTDNPVYERSGVARVFRGGDYTAYYSARCSSRVGEVPSFKDPSLGFRLVRGKQPVVARIQASPQNIDRTQTFIRVNEVKKMTFQYHKQKPRQPAKVFAKYKHEGGLYDKATWKRKARWQRKLRMRNTCTGKLREVEKINSIKGEGTVVTVIRGKNIEKYWVAPFRSDLLGGLGVGDSKDKVMEKLGKPYRKTAGVWAYACEAYDAHAGLYPKKYEECVRVYFKSGAVIAAKYFQTLNCRNVRHTTFFAKSEVLNKMSAAFDKAAPRKQKGFIIYPPLAFVEITTEAENTRLLKGDKPKAHRNNGVKSEGGCEGLNVMESLYTIEGGKAAVIFSGTHNEEIYWVGRFKSDKLKGVAAGNTRKAVIRKLGVPFQRTRNALAYACKYPKSIGKNGIYACLKIFFNKSRVIGAHLDNTFGC